MRNSPSSDVGECEGSVGDRERASDGARGGREVLGEGGHGGHQRRVVCTAGRKQPCQQVLVEDLYIFLTQSTPAEIPDSFRAVLY